jgi:hypothetical protein
VSTKKWISDTGADTGSVQPHDQTTTTVVFFLGGCTYTEIAALRWVSRQNRGKEQNWLGYIRTHRVSRTEIFNRYDGGDERREYD